jgi:hypothetical protein
MILFLSWKLSILNQLKTHHVISFSESRSHFPHLTDSVSHTSLNSHFSPLNYVFLFSINFLHPHPTIPSLSSWVIQFHFSRLALNYLIQRYSRALQLAFIYMRLSVCDSQHKLIEGIWPENGFVLLCKSQFHHLRLIFMHNSFT